MSSFASREPSSPPLYNLAFRKPLGGTEEVDLTVDLHTASPSFSDQSSMSIRGSETPTPTYRAQISASPFPSKPSMAMNNAYTDVSGMKKKSLAQFNEICAKRGEKVDWDFASAGPAHARNWQATLLCESDFFFYCHTNRLVSIAIDYSPLGF